MAHRAFVSRMQVLFSRAVPKPCGQYAAGTTDPAARKKEELECVQRQMQLEHDLVREVVRTYGLASFPKDEHMLLVEGKGAKKKVENRIVSSWRFWDAASKKIGDVTLDRLLEQYEQDVKLRVISPPLRPDAEAKIRMCKDSRKNVKNAGMTENEMREIIRMSYERDSREDFTKLDGIETDCSEQIKEVLQKIGESL
ncbi:MAG: hypothetical protein EB084_25850 [Proteobacteria bacterium]|nr:hypothetical protein [Pseudomonadota bacterium]